MASTNHFSCSLPAEERIASNLDPIQADRLRRDFCTAQATVQKGVSLGRATNTNTAWGIWLSFTAELGISPLLEAFEDKVSVLQIFAERIRTGELAPNGCPIRARSVEDYVRFIGQTFLHMGAKDLRLDSSGNMDFRLKRTWAAWKKEDPPPNRVKPVPIRVIRHIANLAHSSSDINNHYRATADMIILAFFFLLRPGEYIDSNSESSPFRLEDVQLFIGDARLCLQTSPPERLRRASFASLTFTNQKNGVRGEVIGLSRSGDPILCPVRTILRRVLYLRTNNAPPSTPLARTYNTKRVTAASLTTILREAVAFFGPQIGFLPSDVSARCLRAAGATALLLGRVDTDIISLIGRWRSDEMLRYLHVQAYPLMKDYSRKMLNAGDYTLIPNQHVPQH